jgi:hypothetical protein
VGQGVKPAPTRTMGIDVALRLLAAPETPDTAEPRDPSADVRATRRSIARFLRALHASGQGTTAWPSGLVSRLAHADAVTARYLAEPERVDPEQALDAADQLRAIESWVTAKLSPRERARLRTFELAIRVDTDELAQPLVQPDRAPEDDAPALAGTASVGHSLRTGLGALDAQQLDDVGRRLGLRAPRGRGDLERDITRLLRDEALLRILVATLPREALELLGALVRGIGDRATLARLQDAPIAQAVGDSTRATMPIANLRSCALVFASTDHDERFWVPVELRHRIDGLLRALGV